MSDIRFRREHTLGLAKARQIARQCAEQLERRFAMQCTVRPGDDQDIVEFERAGVRGTLVAARDHFEVSATLGLLLGAFSKSIGAEIERNLDSLLIAGAAPADKGRAPKKR